MIYTIVHILPSYLPHHFWYDIIVRASPVVHHITQSHLAREQLHFTEAVLNRIEIRTTHWAKQWYKAKLIHQKFGRI